MHQNADVTFVTGSWKVESLKVRRTWRYDNVKTPPDNLYLRFEPSGSAYIVNATTHLNLASGTWTVKWREVLTASDPFVYRDELVLNLDFGVSALFIEPGSDILIERRKSKLNIHFSNHTTSYRASLIPVNVN
jgi:hypothetical protein